MIITQKKPIEELMAMIGDAKKIAILGCGSCATACATGGEKEIGVQRKDSGSCRNGGLLLYEHGSEDCHEEAECSRAGCSCLYVLR